ncbi:MAG: hypothetical protein HYV16_13540 [Gammaproteobacteria bacterium]|nr:hypothetical protein [Gammaproteobacteria bacterium]
MKLHVEIDATPEELRSFLGLPDISALNAELVAKFRENMDQGVAGYDPASLLKPVLPEALQAMSQLQKTFWQTLAGGAKPSE